MATHGFGIVGCGMIAEFHTRAINEIPARGSSPPTVGPRPTARRSPSSRARLRGLSTISTQCSRSRRSMSSAFARPAGPIWSRRWPRRRAGKHVVVEKPLEITLPRCDAIISACDRGGGPALHDLPLAIHAPRISTLKTAIDTGRFGRLTLGDTYVKWWRTQEYYDSGGWRGTWEPRRRRGLDEPGDPQRRSLAMADGRRRYGAGDDRDAGPRSDRGRGHGRGAVAVQERRARGDRGGHECVSGPAEADRDPRRPRLGPRRAGRHDALGIPAERSLPTSGDSRLDGRRSAASRPARATRAGSITLATATSSPTSSKRSTKAAPRWSTAAKGASRSRSSARFTDRPDRTVGHLAVRGRPERADSRPRPRRQGFGSKE